MSHFYILPENINKDTITVSGGEVHHILDVLHKKIGDKISLFDGMANEYTAEIARVSGMGKERVISARIISAGKSVNEPGIKITLYQSIPKSSKMDFIVRKCTEAGVFKIVPVISERTVVKLDSAKKHARVTRWREIARNAAQQSGRGVVPEVGGVVDFSGMLKDCAQKDSCRIILWESERTKSLKEYLKNNYRGNSSISIIIGPEGGFSHGEVAEAEKSGFIKVTLGPRILRTETAGLITTAIILYEWDS